MDSTHTILSHSLIVICAHPPPIRVYGVNNKSCVTSQITQTAYHLFIVVYHNNSSVCTKATASQTQAFVNELGRLPDLKINWQCSGFFPLVCISLLSPPPCLSTTHNKLWEISLACCGLIFYCLTQLCCIWPSVWVLPFQIGVLHIKSLALKRGKMMCDTYAAILQVLPFWKMQGSGSSSRYHTQRAFFLCKMCFYSLPGFCVWMKRLQDSNCRCVTYNVTT